MNKKTLPLILIIFLGVSLWAYFSYNKNKDSTIAKAPQFNSQLSEEKPRQYLIGYLDSLTKEQIETSGFFSSGYINNQYPKVYSAYYLPNNPDTVLKKITENYNHPESKLGKTRAGVIVFNIINNKFHIIWESEDFLSAAIQGFTKFQDINNDGVDELVLTVGQGARQIPALWIYKWDGSVFKLINPNPGADSESKRWLAGISAELKDVDGDKILEAVVTSEETSLKTREVETINRIYKFNGQEYKLWKEEKVNP